MSVPVTVITSYSEYSPVEETTLGGETEVLVWGFNEYLQKDPTARVYVWFVKSKYGNIYYREKKVEFPNGYDYLRKDTVERFRTVAFVMEYTLCQLFDKTVKIDTDFYSKFDLKHD